MAIFSYFCSISFCAVVKFFIVSFFSPPFSGFLLSLLPHLSPHHRPLYRSGFHSLLSSLPVLGLQPFSIHPHRVIYTVVTLNSLGATVGHSLGTMTHSQSNWVLLDVYNWPNLFCSSAPSRRVLWALSLGHYFSACTSLCFWAFQFSVFVRLGGPPFQCLCLPLLLCFLYLHVLLPVFPSCSSSISHAFLPLVTTPHSFLFIHCALFSFIQPFQIISQQPCSVAILAPSDSVQLPGRFAHLLMSSFSGPVHLHLYHRRSCLFPQYPQCCKPPGRALSCIGTLLSSPFAKYSSSE